MFRIVDDKILMQFSRFELGKLRKSHWECLVRWFCAIKSCIEFPKMTTPEYQIIAMHLTFYIRPYPVCINAFPYSALYFVRGIRNDDEILLENRTAWTTIISKSSAYKAFSKWNYNTSKPKQWRLSIFLPAFSTFQSISTPRTLNQPTHNSKYKLYSGK